MRSSRKRTNRIHCTQQYTDVLTRDGQFVVFGHDVIVLISFRTPVGATVFGFHVVDPAIEHVYGLLTISFSIF